MKKKSIDSKNSKERDYAKSAVDTQNKILNKTLFFTLSGIFDMYSKCSLIVCIVRKVNKLPYQCDEEFF